MAKRTSSGRASDKPRRAPKGKAGTAARAPSTRAPSAAQIGGKQLVIVESPSKAKTINKYLGPDYVVMASVGHVRDLPSKNPKGDKSPVPGVDLDDNFNPTWEVLSGKSKTISELKRAARQASDIWFATDLDREGEAIAWHLAEELGIDPATAKRVIFAAITKEEIHRAFANPHSINLDRVDAYKARRVLDRIVGYQVSPLLWKKVARGLSAGRVQSVAVRLVVEREREIRAFIPDEYWEFWGCFTPELLKAAAMGDAWRRFRSTPTDAGKPVTEREENSWLSEHGSFRAQLIEVAGRKVELGRASTDTADAPSHALLADVRRIAELAGCAAITFDSRENPKGKGPARWVTTVAASGIKPAAAYRVSSIETKRTQSRPQAPFITSTLQQAASTRIGFGARRTMQTAQQLYEGVDIPGEGPVGLITYMRTDSTHLSATAIDMARAYISRHFGDQYLPDKPNVFTSSNKAAQEAHEAIRPTSLDYPPDRVRNVLKPDQLKLYTIIWERFLSCQMTPAQWDSTTVLVSGGTDPAQPVTFRATGRVLVFDGFYRVAGVPKGGDEQTLPALKDAQPLAAFDLESLQRFTAPPPRYTEASLIKTLESEGIGRPSTYASIIQVIQDRKYAEQTDRRFFATDLGEVATDKLVEAFPRILDVGYTRDMEAELDKVEEEHLNWVDMLHRFYGPFKDSLDHAMENLKHAKAEVVPAPPEYRCKKCEASLVYRFGKNGRFLSCSQYPKCDFACPVDREGRPRPAEVVNVRCPKTGRPMVRRTGRFGPFLGTVLHTGEDPSAGMILNIDKKGHVVAPSVPALLTDLPCPKCESPMNLRNGIRGPWLGCSTFPKCRGRGKWTDLTPERRAALEAALAEHEAANPVIIIRTLDGRPLTDEKGKPLPGVPPVEQLVIDEDEAARLLNQHAAAPTPATNGTTVGTGPAKLGSVA